MVLTRQSTRRLASTLSYSQSVPVSEEEPREVEMMEQEVSQGENVPVTPSAGSEEQAPSPDIWTVTFHRHNGGDCGFPSLLRSLFELLHYPLEIEYRGRKRSHPMYPDEWDVTVYIQEADYEHGGTKEVAVHDSIAVRSTFEAGIQDAARQALSVLCQEEAHGVSHTTCAYLPRRKRGALSGEVPEVPDEQNSTLNLQVGFTAMLNTQLDVTTRELLLVRDELATERRKNKRLRAELKGEVLLVEDEDDEVDRAQSPPRC